jgi:hypothetical protein
MKKNNFSYKLKYERYLKLICRCLSGDIYTELTYKRISYREVTYVYGKAHMIVVQVIIRLEVTKLSYIESVML